MQKKTTIRLFDQDSYLKEFQGTVLACNEEAGGIWSVVLDRTAFFPEGGGQSGDSGYLGNVEITGTIEKDGIIYHQASGPLEVGKFVEGQINFEERFDKMQQHTGEHIISGIVNRLYGYRNVGFHLSNEVTTLDFDGELSKEQVQDLEIRVNEVVFANLPVDVSYPDKKTLGTLEYRSKIEIEGQVRLVGIPGVDLCACCAPHVRMTGEVGLVKILSCERHRGGCRLTILCGRRALKDYQAKQEISGKISVALSAKPDKLDEAVARLQEQQQSLREQLNSVQARYLQEKLASIDPEDSVVCIFEENLDSVAVRNFVNAAMEQCDGICGAFIGNEKSGYHYILGSSKKDVRETAKILNEHFQGKGGGKPQMVQGSLSGREGEIRKALMSRSGQKKDIDR
ncbi:MAG: DHHA1 domain-containing protein [Lachnospiraceae bacterium]